jgi:GNAT superfamily N-acetyltransferase
MRGGGKSKPGSEAAPVIRAARSGEEEQIARLSGQLGYPATPEEIRLRLEALRSDPRHAVYVAAAAAGGRLLGWVHVFLYRGVESDVRAEIGGLVVDATHRGRGAGRLLMEEAERWARGSGCRRVTLRSNVIREEAHRFYRKLGYELHKTQHAFRKEL